MVLVRPGLGGIVDERVGQSMTEGQIRSALRGERLRGRPSRTQGRHEDLPLRDGEVGQHIPPGPFIHDAHSGGVAPFLLSRFEVQEQLTKDAQQKLPRGMMYELRKFYYETAQGNHSGALTALMKIAPISQMLYGTDHPFRLGAEENAGLGQYGFSAADLIAIERDNALRLLPKLKA